MTKKDGDKLRAMARDLKAMANEYGGSEEAVVMVSVAQSIDDLLVGRMKELRRVYRYTRSLA